MSEWIKTTLNEIADVIGGGTPSTKNEAFWGGEIPWITPKDLTGYTKMYISHGERFITKSGLDNSSTRLLPEGSVLMSSRAPIGYVAIAANPITTNQGFKSLVPNTELANNKFLYFWIKNNKQYIDSLGSGTTFAEVSGSVVKSLEIELPSLAEQKAIASVLSSLDNKIDLLHRQNKTLESMAETLFRQCFVEEAQDDWVHGTLKDEFAFTMGQSPKGSSFNEERIGTPMFQGNADFGFRFPKERVYTTEPTRFAQKLDTLISVRAPVGAQNMARSKCCIGRGVAAFRHINNLDWYTYTYFKLRYLMDEIKKFNDEGTVFGSISKSDFEKIEVVIPPASIIYNYEIMVKPLNDRVITNCFQIEKLENLRDTLLPKLMSGEVRVNYTPEEIKQ
ncbi:restriction endonuclease subunit S [Enterobacteriaceae bacterium TYF_5]